MARSPRSKSDNKRPQKRRQQRALCPHCCKVIHRNSVQRHIAVYGVPQSLARSVRLPWNIPKPSNDDLLSWPGLASDDPVEEGSVSGDDRLETSAEDLTDQLTDTVAGEEEEEWQGISESDSEHGVGDSERVDAAVSLPLGEVIEPIGDTMTELPAIDLLFNAASSTSGSDLSEGLDWESNEESTGLDPMESDAEDEMESELPMEYGISPILPAPNQAGYNYQLEIARAEQRNGVPDGSSLYTAIRAYRYQMKNNLGVNAFEELRNEFPELQLPSLKILRRLMRELSGVEPKFTDCCPESCICYTSHLSSLTVCPICGSERYRSDGTPANQLLHLPLTPQLRACYAGIHSARAMRYRARHQDDHSMDPKETIADIYDSEHYRSLREAHPVVDDRPLPHHFFDDARDVLLVGLTDGFQIFKRGKHTAWPVVYVNANLSPEERYKDENLIIVGLIPGPNKPKNFNSFMFVFAEELIEGAVGVSAYDALRDEMFVLRFYAPFGGGDMPAVAAAWLNSKGHNAKLPCRACEIEGIRIPTEESDNKTHYIPIQRPPHYPENTATVADLPLRSHQRYLEQARQIDLAPSLNESRRLATLYGINGVPMSSHIPGIRFPVSFPHDLMHLTVHNLSNFLDFISGNFKTLDSGLEDYILPKTVWAAIGEATVQANSTIPSSFGRRIKNVATERFWFTAESYVVWSTLYAPILLRGRFSKPKYYKFFLLTISIIERCMAFKSTSEERSTLRQDIQDWYLQYEKIFYQYTASRLPACLLTIHAWLHAVDDMEKSGPLPCFWCWCMERICGRLHRAITSRKHPYASLNRRIIEIQTLRAIINKYDLQSRLAKPSSRARNATSFDDDAYDDYTLLPPRKALALSSGVFCDLRRRISVCLSTRLELPPKTIEKFLPLSVEQWARVQMHEGDLIHSRCGYLKPRVDARDATYVQYELLVDIHRHQRRIKPVFKSRTFFGRLERILVVQLPPTPQLNIQEASTFILADILPCKTTRDKYGFYEYTAFESKEVVDLNAIRAVVGRIRDRGKWVIVQRKGGIDHAQYYDEDDVLDN